MFESAAADALLELANQRLKKFPQDANAYWYRARAYAQKMQWAQAIANLEQTAFLAPSWKADDTDPLIAQLRTRARAS